MCCTGKEGEVVTDKQVKEKGQTFIKMKSWYTE